MISIIIPTYNRSKMLRKALESVCKQIYTDWECIVIDDGSYDDTHEVVREIQLKEHRIRYYYQSNAERCVARNNGIEKAKGEYICFLDSDDQYEENHLLGIYNFIKNQKEKEALFFTNFKVNGIPQGKMTDLPSELNSLTSYLLMNSIIPDRVCIHREVLRKYKFDSDITIGEDAMLWARIAQGYPVVAIEQSTVLYNLHSDNTINIKNNSGTKLLNGLTTYFSRYPIVKGQISLSDQKLMFANIYFTIAKYHILQLSSLKAIQSLLRSLLLFPRHKHTKYKLYLIVKIFSGKISMLKREVT